MLDKPEHIQYIDNLPELDKLTIYMDYFVENRMLELQNRKTYLNSFDIFKNHILIHDHGENWRENGFAQQNTIHYLGIYEHYYKFKNRINYITNDT